MKPKVYLILGVALFIIIILMAAVGGLVYFMVVARTEPVVIPTATRTEAQRVATVQAQFTATALAGPPPTPTVISARPTRPLETPTPSSALRTIDNTQLGFTFEYPDGWYKQETEEYLIVSPSDLSLEPGNFSDFAVRFGRVVSATTPSALLTSLWTQFPAQADTVGEGALEIDSLSWNAVQRRFVDPNSNGLVLVTIAVTVKDGQIYYLIATAPETEWDRFQPFFQGIRNSFRFVGG